MSAARKRPGQRYITSHGIRTFPHDLSFQYVFMICLLGTVSMMFSTAYAVKASDAQESYQKGGGLWQLFLQTWSEAKKKR